MRLLQSALFTLAAFAIAGCGANSNVAGALPVDIAVTHAGNAKPSGHKTFRYNGKVQVFAVPAHVTSMSVDIRGAAGGGKSSYAGIGLGGRIVAVIPVRPHEELYVFVGSQGLKTSGGFNGGGNPGAGGGSDGGGGASDVRKGLSLRDRLVVGAGGGGEGNYETETGGDGGGLTGGDGGSYCYSYTDSCGGNGGGDGGGTQSAGGSGGTAGGAGTGGSAPGKPGAAGVLGSGGNGGAAGCGYTSGLCRCGYSDGCPGAGGGGGFYGGGGGGGGAGTFGSQYGGLGAGGGGGSSWAEARATDVRTWTGWSSANDGLVIIKW